MFAPNWEKITRKDILHFLRSEDSDTLQSLWLQADAVRKRFVGDEIHLRGLIEVSNICTAQCTYCGIRVKNPNISRYRMMLEEILECVRLSQRLEYGSIVLQAGESSAALPTEWVTKVIEEIRKISDQAITLSLGERPENDWKAYRDWFSAGANRYLVRFETSNPKLFQQLHPGHPGLERRLTALKKLREVGFEIGSGVMVGVPGQTWNDLANDVELFRDLDLDMIGVGPFIPHAETPLGKKFYEDSALNTVPNDEMTTLKTVALTRLVCPKSNIPATTALACVDRSNGRQNGLARGANVVMPNVTPAKYRKLYEIYPSKVTAEAAEFFDRILKENILAIGRKIGKGRGDSVNKES